MQQLMMQKVDNDSNWQETVGSFRDVGVKENGKDQLDWKK